MLKVGRMLEKILNSALHFRNAVVFIHKFAAKHRCIFIFLTCYFIGGAFAIEDKGSEYLESNGYFMQGIRERRVEADSGFSVCPAQLNTNGGESGTERCACLAMCIERVDVFGG